MYPVFASPLSGNYLKTKNFLKFKLIWSKNSLEKCIPDFEGPCYDDSDCCESGSHCPSFSPFYCTPGSKFGGKK